MARLSTRYTFFSLPEALVVKSLLEASGFFCVLHDGYFSHVDWFKLRAIGGVRLAVLESDVAEIDDLLGDLPAQSIESTSEECSNCHSRHLFKPRSFIIGILTFFLSGIPLYVYKGEALCMNCKSKVKRSRD